MYHKLCMQLSVEYLISLPFAIISGACNTPAICITQWNYVISKILCLVHNVYAGACIASVNGGLRYHCIHHCLWRRSPVWISQQMTPLKYSLY